ncbi:hypothetical protein SAMN05443247_06427 [Bradyrhizobium erythrophlei]|nr:hypothetical protein SAMN05443247_06427 [Bradyrhizobium erythrophlei]
MSKAELEKAITDKSHTAESWRSNIKAIEAKIADANSRRTKAEALRKQFALNASLGNTAATESIAKARAEHELATGDLKDFASALIEANERLVEAEREVKVARSNLAKFETDILKRQRVDLAGQLDQAIEALAGLYQQYEKLGRAIVDMDVIPHNTHLTTNFDSALGNRRVRAACPKLFDRVFPNAVFDEMKKEPLATSESRYWFGEPVEITTTKAA